MQKLPATRMRDLELSDSAGPDALSSWRALMLSRSLQLMSLVTLLLILSFAPRELAEGRYDFILVQLLNLAALLGLAATRRISYSARAALTILAIAGLCLQRLALLGSVGEGRLYLFFLIVLTALLLTRHWAWLVWGALTLLTAAVATAVAAGTLPLDTARMAQLARPEELPAQTLAAAASALILGLVIVALIERLARSMQATEQALRDRDEANRLLEQRVRERTDELEQALASVRASEIKYSVLFQTLPAGVSITDEHGQILEVNRASERLLGISASGHRQRTIDADAWQVVRPDGSPMPAEEFASVRALREDRLIEDVEMGILRPDAEPTWISVTAAPIRMPGYGAAIIYIDVSARRRADETLARQLRMQSALGRCAQLLLQPASGEAEQSAALAAALEALRPHVDALQIILVANSAEGGDQPVARVRAGVGGNPHGLSAGAAPPIPAIPLAGLDPALRRALTSGRHWEGSLSSLGVAELWPGRAGVERLRCLPIMVEGGWWGTLAFTAGGAAGGWDEHEVTLMRTAAEVIATAVQRWDAEARLERQLAYSRATELARSVSAAHLRALRDALPDQLFVLRADGTFLEYHAPRSAELLLPLGDFLGRTLEEVLPPEIVAQARAAMASVLSGASSARFDYQLPLVDEEAVFEARVVHIADDLLLFVVRNVTELRSAAAALLRAKEAAEAADQAKSTFLAHISHELRTPLTAVIGMAGLLRDTQLTTRQREYAATIQTGAETLLHIIGNILDLSKIEVGKLELAAQPFNLIDCCREALDIVEFTAISKGLALSFAVGADAPALVLGDAARLRQVLVNLLGNAVKFTDRGVIALRIAGATGEQGRRGVTISVRDPGIGIEQGRLAHIFDPFVQADSATTRRFGGTGLGLTISKQLVELMGGTISADSAPGAGSTFTLTLPLAVAEPAAAAPEHEAAPQPAGEPLRLLVAEDNPVNQNVLRRLLEGLGYSAEVVGTGRAAVAAVAAAPFDVVLMDIQMPELDGVEATRQIRALATAHQPYIVALTASALAGDRERYLAAGMDSYLSKPLQLDDLRRVLERAGGPPRPERDVAADLGAPAGGRSAAPLIDWELLETLMVSLGMGREQAGEMVLGLFRAKVAEQLAELREAVRAMDSARIRRQAHMVRGGSRQIGALALAECCLAIEGAADRASAGEVGALIGRAQQIYDQTLAQLSQRLGGG